MLRSLRVVLVLVPLAFLVPLLVPESADTLPLFARKYSMPCTQCHLAFPRLNKFGMKFKQNGYRLEGAKGESPWDAHEFPLSLVGNVGYDYVSTDAADSTGARVRTNVGAFQQNAVEFHSAGTLAEKITFHFDNGFAGAAGVLESGMAFVQFDDVAKNGALNVKAGIYDAEIPYISDARATTRYEYVTPATLDGRGIELNGTQAGWSYAAGLINSERTQGKPSSKTLNNLENVYAWLMRDVRGQLVTARVLLDQQDPRKADANSSQHLMAQVSAYLNSGNWVLIPGYTFGKFSDADSILRDKAHIALLEGLVLFGKEQRWVLTARYELEHLPKATIFAEEDDALVDADLAYYVNPNARVALDWAHTSDNVKGPKVDEVQFFVHVGY